MNIMKKFLLTLLTSVMFLSVGTACAVAGLGDRVVYDFYSEPVLVYESWDAADSTAPEAEVPTERGSFSLSDEKNVSIRFVGEPGLRFTLPFGRGESVAALLPSDATDIAFGAVLVPYEDITDGWKEEFVAGNVYSKTKHAVATACSEITFASVEELSAVEQAGLETVVVSQDRNFDTRIACRGMIVYTVGGEKFAAYSDEYIEGELYDIADRYVTEGVADRKGFVDHVLDTVTERIALDNEMKLGLREDFGDYVSSEDAVDLEGLPFDFTEEKTSLISLGSDVTSSESTLIRRIITPARWANILDCSEHDIYIRAYADGQILDEILSTTLAKAEEARIVISAPGKEDFLDITIRADRYVGLEMPVGEFVFDGTDVTERAFRTTIGGSANLVVSQTGAVEVGDYTVSVSAEGRRLLNKSNPTAQEFSFTIQPRPIEITLDDVTVVYGDEEAPLTYKASGYVEGYEPVVAVTREEGYIVGEYGITATLEGANYTCDIAPAVYTIIRAAFTASPDYTLPESLTAVYGAQLSSVTLPVGWTWTLQEGTVGNVGFNTFAAEFVPADTHNYESGSSEFGITVTKASVALPVMPESFVYDTTSHEVSIPQGTVLSAHSDGVTPTETGFAFTDAGTHEITVALEDAPNHKWEGTEEDDAPRSYNIIVARANVPLSVSFSSAEYVYDGTAHHPVLEGDLPEWLTVSYSNTVDAARTDWQGETDVTGEQVDVYAHFTLIGKAADNYNLPESLHATMLIVPKTIDVEWEGADSVTYDGNEHGLKARITLVDGTTHEFETPTHVDAGSYDYAISYDDPNYNLTVNVRQLVIHKKEGKLLENNIPTSRDLDATIEFSFDEIRRFVEGDIDDLPKGDEREAEYASFVTVRHEDGGAWLPGMPNRTGTYSMEVTLNEGKNYTAAAAPVVLGFTIDGEGKLKFISQESVTVVGSGFMATYAGKAYNFAINPAANFSAVAYSFAANGGDVQPVEGDKIALTHAGSYAITAVVSFDTDLEDQTVTANVTIEQAPITITVNNRTVTYSGLPQSVTAEKGTDWSVSGSYYNDDDLGLTLTATYTNAGAYPIVAAITNTDYKATFKNAAGREEQAQFTIQKAPLTLTAKSATVTYMDNAPVYAYEYSGFVNGEKESVLKGMHTLTCAYTRGSGVQDGGYTITASYAAGEGDNYAVTPVNGTLTVIRADVTVTAEIADSKPYYVTGNILTINFTAHLADGTDVGAEYLASPNASTIKNSVGTPAAEYKITHNFNQTANLNASSVSLTVNVHATVNIYARKDMGEPTLSKTYDVDLATSPTVDLAASVPTVSSDDAKHYLTADMQWHVGETVVSGTYAVTDNVDLYADFTGKPHTLGELQSGETHYKNCSVCHDNVYHFVLDYVAEGSETLVHRYTVAYWQGSDRVEVSALATAVAAAKGKGIKLSAVYSVARPTITVEGDLTYSGASKLTVTHNSDKYTEQYDFVVQYSSGSAYSAVSAYVNAGSYKYSATLKSGFVWADDEGTAEITGEFTVAKATPQLGYAKQTLHEKYEGATVSGNITDAGITATFGGKSVAGTPLFSDGKTTYNVTAKYSAEGTSTEYYNQPIAVVFNPTDTVNYNSVTGEVYVKVLPVAYLVREKVTENKANSSFDKTEGNDTWKNAGVYFGSIEAAAEAATANQSIYVMLGVNPTVKKSFEVKSGVRLIIPHKMDIAKKTAYYVEFSGSGANEAAAGVCKSNVTLDAGVVITVNGTLKVGGIISGGGGSNARSGQTSADHAKITLKSSASIVVNGSMVLYGFVTSQTTDSKVEIKSGGSIVMPFVVNDFRGGSITAGNHDDPQECMPFNEFEMPNIKDALFIVHSGGKLIGQADLYADSQHNTTQVTIIGAGAFIDLSKNADSRVEIRYNSSTRIADLQFYNGGMTNSLVLSVAGENIDTKSLYFAISWRFHVTLNSGDYSMSQLYKLLPGAEFTVAKDATLTVGNLTVYSSFTDAGDGHPKYQNNSAGTVPAKLTVAGKLIATNLAGEVIASGTGASLTVSGSNSVITHELSGHSGSWIFTTVSYQAISFALNGKYWALNETIDGASLSAGTYKSINGVWYKDAKFSVEVVYGGRTVFTLSNLTAGAKITAGQITPEDIFGFNPSGKYYMDAALKNSFSFDTALYGDVTLYTTYDKDASVASKSITLNAGEGKFDDGSSTKKLDVPYSETVTTYTLYDVPAREHWVLSGWSKTSGGSVNFNNGTAYSLTDIFGEANSVELYAVWAPCMHTITVKNTGTKFTIDGKTYTGTSDKVEVQCGQTVSWSVTNNGSNWKAPYSVTSDNSSITFSGTSSKFTMPHGDLTITATATNSGCLVEGTLIQMADGTLKPVEQLVAGDEVLVFNHITGKYEKGKLWHLNHASDGASEQTVINLRFSNGATLRTVSWHGLFDLDERKYVFFNATNAADYIGHRFATAEFDGAGFTAGSAVLVDVEITHETVRFFGTFSEFHLNIIAEGMLTMTAGMENLLNFFAFDDNMQYNAEDYAYWVETVGLYTYEDFKDYLTEEQFNMIPLSLFKIPVAKGLITYDALVARIKWLFDEGFFQR